MFSNLQELEDRVFAIIQNERAGEGLSQSVVSEGCLTAVATVSRLMPLETSDTLSGDGSEHTFALSGLDPSWVAGLSYIRHVEYPADEQDPTILDESEWELFPSFSAATHLKFPSIVPASGSDNIRVVYTSVHTVSDTASTWPDHLEPGIEHAAAAVAAEVYAAKYGHTTDPSIDADAIDYGALVRAWLDLAERHRRIASNILGVDLTGDTPSGGSAVTGARPRMLWADTDITPSYGSLLFRTKKRR